MLGKIFIAIGGMGLLGVATAQAGLAPLDLTTPGASGFLAGGFFQQGDVQPAGTGVFNTFVQIQGHGANNTVQQGYNTDYRPVQFDEKNDAPHNHSLLLSNVPVVNVGGTNYREFLLDINEPKGQDKNFLSLDNIQIFQGSAGNLHNYPTFGGAASEIFDLSTSGTYIKLDAALSHGSGQSDMIAYIPDSLFNQSTPYVYLYSHFGSNIDAVGGFEEWGVSAHASAVPLPSAVAQGLVGFGVLGCLSLVGTVRRRRLAVR